MQVGGRWRAGAISDSSLPCGMGASARATLGLRRQRPCAAGYLRNLEGRQLCDYPTAWGLAAYNWGIGNVLAISGAHGCNLPGLPEHVYLYCGDGIPEPRGRSDDPSSVPTPHLPERDWMPWPTSRSHPCRISSSLADEIHVSVCFTWDLPEAQRLVGHGAAQYPGVPVRLGGSGWQQQGQRIHAWPVRRAGRTFTTRGCNTTARGAWCQSGGAAGRDCRLAEATLSKIKYPPGPRSHLERVGTMLNKQRGRRVFSVD